MSRRPYLVGLTGGIASGKTTVSNAFESLGVPVIDADLIAREVVLPGTPGLAAVVAAFGADVLHDDGTLDRGALRERVFADPARRGELEEILHPRIRALMFERAAASRHPYCVLAIPLLVEGGLYREMDRVLVVDVDEAEQRRRLALRDGATERQIDQLLAAQASREERLAVADDVLDNSGPVERVAGQVDALHRSYLERAGKASDDA